MNLDTIYKEAEDFTRAPHGSTNYDKDEVYVHGLGPDIFVPYTYLKKKFESLKDEHDLVRLGLVMESLDFFNKDGFNSWFEKQFGKKLTTRHGKKIIILHRPDNLVVLDAVEQIHRFYEILRKSQIIINGKNLPTQLGEWYAKSVFGLKQMKSTSQRGFDFFLDEKKVEVKVHWGDSSSLKGVKIKRSMLELSEHTILIYLSKNFTIREICFLDSNYIIRKFAGKGTTVFLKDSEIGQYFFSRSNKHDDKIINKTNLLKFSSPHFAVKISDRIAPKL